MHKVFFILLMLLTSQFTANAQKPKNGTYTYAIAWDEWGGKTLGATCTVIIKGDSIRVLHNGKKNVTGKKGDIMDEGLIRKHKKTGKWIISHSEKDADAPYVNGCEGPSEIDFIRKLWHSC